MPRTFICHASADRLFLSREIIPLLNRHGIETWFSGEDIRTADEWEQSIRRGLEECDWFLVALSPRALESHWVRAELHWAVDRRQGRVVPILLESCDPIALHLKLSQIQYVDFTTPSDSARRKLLASWGVAYEPPQRTAVEEAQRMREAVASIRGHSLIKTLGRGSTAYVFLARSEARGLVAIKVLDPGIGPDYVTTALQVVRAMERIHHPAVISIYEVGEVDEFVYIIMEYAAGPTLADAIRFGELPARQTVEMVANISDGLAATHSFGVMHRDLKPQNIFLDRQGRPHIADFGMRPLAPGHMLGTVSYGTSPEYVMGMEMDQRSDIWSLGVILYELLTKRRPFSGGLEILHQILSVDPTPPRQIVPSLPEELERICLKCLAKQPDQRYQTASDLGHDLRRWLATEDGAQARG